MSDRILQLINDALASDEPTKSVLELWTANFDEMSQFKIVLFDNLAEYNFPVQEQQWGQKGKLLSAYSGNKFLFLSEDILGDMLLVEKAAIPLDYDILLDSNAASQMAHFVHSNERFVENDFASGLHNFGIERFNWNIGLYLEEAGREETPSDKTLKHIWDTALANKMLMDIDEEYFYRTKKFRLKEKKDHISETQKLLSYQQNKGNAEIWHFYEISYACLLKASTIKLLYPKTNRSTKSFIEFTEWALNELGAWMPFVKRMMLRLFTGDKETDHYFRKVKSDTKNLCMELQNMAWDMAFWAWLQRYCGSKGRNNSIMIPFFLTFDVGLQQIAKLMKMKACVIAQNKPPLCIPEYPPEEEIFKVLEGTEVVNLILDGIQEREIKRARNINQLKPIIKSLECELEKIIEKKKS